MKRRLGLILMTFLVAAGPAFGETIFGNFNGATGDRNAGNGFITFNGWALADSGVRMVVILVDGKEVHTANLGKPRPRVLDKYPGYPDSEGPGFVYNLNTTLLTNGRHKVEPMVITEDGNTKIIGPPAWVDVFNAVPNLLPFGKIRSVHPNADLFGTCDRNGPIRLVVIEGWALDLGLNVADTGIGWVELVVDDAPALANTRYSCGYNPGAGGFTTCYGLFTPEIQRNYPFAVNAPAAGFRFVMDVGAMIAAGYSQGNHELTIRASDKLEQFRNIDSFPVFFRCIEDINEGSSGTIELPRKGRIYFDELPIQGWAVDWEGVDRVRILIDGVFIGNADYGAEDGIFETRPRVFSQYFGFVDVEAPVWRLEGFDSNDLSDGRHEIQVVVVDKEGDRTVVGERTFHVNNRPR